MIVEAVGAAVGWRSQPQTKRELVVQQAMSAAAAIAQQEGITDPAVIRERMLAARSHAQEK